LAHKALWGQRFCDAVLPAIDEQTWDDNVCGLYGGRVDERRSQTMACGQAPLIDIAAEPVKAPA